MTLANVLSTARAFLVLPVIGLIAIGDHFAAMVVFLVAAASDALDGPLARRRGGATALGAALDPLADKILVVGALSALALTGFAPTWAVAVIVARELSATVVRARSPHIVAASADGKAKTILQVAAIVALFAAEIWTSAGAASAANGLLVAATALTVLSGVRLVLRAKQTTADTA